jgi:hypothetical protein
MRNISASASEHASSSGAASPVRGGDMNLCITNNVLHDLIRADIDPVMAVEGSEFVLSVKPDLAEE